jgi:predicted phosphohydrolase
MSADQTDGPIFKVETVRDRWARVYAFGQEIPRVIHMTHETEFSNDAEPVTKITFVLAGAQVEQVVKGE